MTVRPLVAADVDAVAEADFAAFHDVALRHGRRPLVGAVRDSRAYVRRLLEADPLGGVVAEESGLVVGHAWTHVRGPIATIGPLAVEPAAQRRGIGRALLAHCLQSLGPRVTQVRLAHDSDDLVALHLYLSAGFRIVAPLLELEREAGAPPTSDAAPSNVAVRPATASDRAAIVARDARVFGTARPQDVERRLRDGRGVVAERGKALAGYALAAFATVGPAAGDDPELVLALVAALAAAFPSASGLRALVLGTDRVLVDGLRARGFRLRRACHYMVRGGGTAPPPGYVLMGPDLL